jgi:LysM domain
MDQSKPGSDSPGGPPATVPLGNASLQEIRNLKPLTSQANQHLPNLLIEGHDHTVAKGETLSELAKEHLGKGASTRDIYNYVNELGKLNHLKDVNKIHVGQTIHFGEAHIHGSHTHPGHHPHHADKPVAPAHHDGPATPEAPANPAAPTTPSKPDVPPKSDAPTTPDRPAAKPEESGFMGFIHKAEAVVSDIGAGVVDEVVNHPGEVLKNAAIGVGVAVGAALLAPEIAVVAAVAGVAAGGYELIKHGGEWIHAGDVVANPEGHTVAEQKQAHDTLHGVGQGITDLAAGVAGGAIGTLGVKIAGQVLAGEAGAAITAGRAGAAEATAGRTGAAETTAGRAAGAESGEAGAAKGAGKGTLENEKPAAAEAPKPEDVVRIKSPDEYHRQYEVNGKSYDLRGRDGDAWYYGKNLGGDISPVKIHVNISGPEDLAAVQKALIPFLNDNPEAKELSVAWKTFDPNAAVGKGIPDYHIPGSTGQSAKGFTVYARTAEDAARLEALLDKQLTAKGLGLKNPIETGNVDIIRGTSNRVGTVRDFYPLTRDAIGSPGAAVDDGLAQRIETSVGGGNKLTETQLRSVEEETGLKSGSLTYDKDGKLMLKMRMATKPRNGLIYADESRAEGEFGHMTDRPAIYALSRFFHWNPANGAK